MKHPQERVLKISLSHQKEWGLAGWPLGNSDGWNVAVIAGYCMKRERSRWWGPGRLLWWQEQQEKRERERERVCVCVIYKNLSQTWFHFLLMGRCSVTFQVPGQVQGHRSFTSPETLKDRNWVLGTKENSSNKQKISCVFNSRHT